MNINNKIIESAKRTISIEGNSILNLIKSIDSNFVKAVKKIHKSTGRVIITGIGKSSIIAKKIVSSMNSTGTPAIFLHSVDAIHGDIGIIQSNDTVICISNSGNSSEIEALIPSIKTFKNYLIGITGNKESYLAKMSDVIISTYIKKEACPNNLAPTSSTSAQLAIGDAMMVCLLELKNFKKMDYAKFHPGGTLGKKLILNLGMLADKNPKPIVKKSTSFKELIIEISKNRLGASVVMEKKKIVGIVTDGDIRRIIEKTDSIKNITVKNIMSKNPFTVNKKMLAYDAINLMKLKSINHLIIIDNKNNYYGIVHILDLINEGINEEQ